MRPDFLLIGSMKCGTSTVSAYLEDHPEVFMLPGQEPNFFSHDKVHDRGAEWYERLFDGAAGARRIGEGSNDYASGLMYPDTAARIAAYSPEMRLIYMVRDPVARLASAWVQNRVDQGDQVPPTLERAVREMPDLYLGQSLYWHNLQLYRTHFPDDRIFIGFMEDLKTDRFAFFARLCGFLGIEPMNEIPRGHINPSRGKAVPGQLYSALNALPGIGRLKALAPKGLRSTVKTRLLSRRIGETPEIPAALRRELTERLGPDTRAFLAHCGRPTDFWGL
ncbi:sulfotransferase domain-containing protein [Rhodovulum sulfidophilum]|uniref:sulfotransferase domain-containing protein n=1 Tax=Rhodovulum sulfidophilum TaxID=35806 RepID=UPI000952703B|nr:sulfotransferase domain-containing protein [Rhodovulum sulfidophilum]MCE8455038.1 sulfotransferase domain-containing protein [Rhodovulum sulfidophilum]OLS42446.1 hypothetical protein BV379_20530 [Rhodovulum sulfidophilum]